MVDQSLDRHRLRPGFCHHTHSNRHAGGADGDRQFARAASALLGGAAFLAVASIRAVVRVQEDPYHPYRSVAEDAAAVISAADAAQRTRSGEEMRARATRH